MKRNPLQAIRAKCIECSCGNREEIVECPVKTCALWDYRLPTQQNASPDSKGPLTPPEPKETGEIQADVPEDKPIQGKSETVRKIW